MTSIVLTTALLLSVELPAVFGDHMVLQEGRKVPFWGTAAPGEKVTVSVAGLSASVNAEESGRWRLEIGPVPGPGPHVVNVNDRRYTDVLVGEVWLASGQSNMEFMVSQAVRGDLAVETARHPKMRLFRAKHPAILQDHPTDVEGSWAACTPESAHGFSAVGYFFGRELLGKLDKPIGIIDNSWGGTRAEAWTSRKTLAASADFKADGVPVTLPADMDESFRRHQQELSAWYASHSRRDPGNQGEGLGYASSAPQIGWPTMVLPNCWEKAGLVDLDGVVWFRRRVALPPELVGHDLDMRLGPIADCDTTYINGVKVGGVCKEVTYPNRWPRRYRVPAAATRPGQFLVAVRVYDGVGTGGMCGDPGSMTLARADGNDGPTVSLAGEWAYKIEATLPVISDKDKPQPPPGTFKPNVAGVLYDNMLAPLIPFAIRGVIWYQGESNVAHAYRYRTLFPLMINDWRRAWGQGDFPFLFVQLANFRPPWQSFGFRREDNWAELREAQAMTLSVPQTGMAVAIDVGERDDIHPRNKQEVGRRLALWALARTYGQSIEYRGPTFAGYKVQGSAVRISFQAGQGMRARPGGMAGFTIAGADRVFVEAQARVDGETLVVTAPGLVKPVAVRYAWSDDPEAGLVNAAGLPAVPFRTDTWPELTRHAGERRPIPTR